MVVAMASFRVNLPVLLRILVLLLSLVVLDRKDGRGGAPPVATASAPIEPLRGVPNEPRRGVVGVVVLLDIE